MGVQIWELPVFRMGLDEITQSMNVGREEVCLIHLHSLPKHSNI